MGLALEIRSVSFAGLPVRTRLAFRFGMATLVEAPVLVARVGVRVEERESTGFAADLLVPKWFEKNPAKSSRDDIAGLLASARRAGQVFEGATGSTFEIWRAADRACVAGPRACGVPLLDGFGVALVERALIDAICRAAGVSFRGALEQDLFGFEPGRVLAETEGLAARDLIVPTPPERVLLRHTVGGLDPLRASEVSAAQRRDDGHPIALEEDIARYGLRAFKLKVGSGPAADTERLAGIARVVAECGVRDPIYTLDGNEQYPDLEALGALLSRLEGDPDGRRILANLLYIEQPLPREATLDPATRDAVTGIAREFPLLIDEADADVDSFSQALEIGYRGVSVKNCKGVFRALVNRALCLRRGGGAFQTSEDLTNLPVLSLQQDLTTLAVLGLEHTERNGHHFFAGLDVLPPGEAESALQTHPDLYERKGDRIQLAIRDGGLSLACQHATGYGYSSQIDWDARTPIDALEAGLED